MSGTRKDFFGLRYPNHEPIYLDRFGIEFQISGMIVTGKDNKSIVMMLPGGYGIHSLSTIVKPTVDEWIQLLKQMDDPEYYETSPDGKIVKAIHRKNMRQIAYDIQWQVYRRVGFKCEYCGGERPLTIDHYVPVELGGTDELSNLKAACRSCNKRKGNMSPDEWEKLRGGEK